MTYCKKKRNTINNLTVLLWVPHYIWAGYYSPPPPARYMPYGCSQIAFTIFAHHFDIQFKPCYFRAADSHMKQNI